MVEGRTLANLGAPSLLIAHQPTLRKSLEALGEFRAGHFRPGHDLALALGEGDARAVCWAAGDPRLAVYLSGADLPATELPTGPDGWLLVAVDGFGLGWGKRAAGRLKNHYPRALRR